MKVLWLASWYPNLHEPYNGDFIQRHAIAVASVIPVDVIHVLQTGHKVNVADDAVTITKKDGLTEYICSFAFRQTGIGIVDKIRYNILYHRFYRKVVKDYIQQNGRPDLVHVHVPVKAGLMALELMYTDKIPYIVSEQSSHYEERSPDYFFLRSKYFRHNTRRIFENALAVTNVSATIGSKLQSLFHIRSYKTIHNLVDTTKFFYSEPLPHHTLRLLHVSSMSEQKNVAGIITALATFDKHYKYWQCTFCGPHAAGLQEMAATAGIADKLFFTGEIAYADVALQMQQADFFVLFSNHENFPCVVVEALCCGLPVVSSDAGGVREAIDESNGLLVAVGDEQQLADALKKLTANRHVYNRPLIASQAKGKYNAAGIASAFVELYRSTINKTGEKQQRI